MVGLLLPQAQAKPLPAATADLGEDSWDVRDLVAGAKPVTPGNVQLGCRSGVVRVVRDLVAGNLVVQLGTPNLGRRTSRVGFRAREPKTRP